MDSPLHRLSRRTLMRGGAGLTIGLVLNRTGGRLIAAPAALPAKPFAPNAFIRIGRDDLVTVVIKHTELGQGAMTGITTLAAEELDADWSQMRTEMAPANAKLYANLRAGTVQVTGDSSAIFNSFDQMRRAAATARAMLVSAAAEIWLVPASEIGVESGIVRHAVSGRKARFGELVDKAAAFPAPASITLKDPSSFRFIGKDGSVKRIDVPSKTNGSAQFGQDMHESGMLTVVVARAPLFGGKVTSYDAGAARKIKGVVDVRQIPSGVAVYAKDTFSAIKGRSALAIAWDDSEAEKRGTEAMFAELSALCRTPGNVAGTSGDAAAEFQRAEAIVESEYSFPFLAHAPMEPLTAYIHWNGKAVKARYASQSQSVDQATIARILGLTIDDVGIETMLAGGSFGRRGDGGGNQIAELAEAAKAIGPNQPLKLIWTREDDIRGGYYRPMMVHRLRAVIREGRIAAWSHTMAGHSFMVGSPLEKLVVKNGIDHTMTEGAGNLPYNIPNFRCEVHVAKTKVPTRAWRAVGHTHTAYAVECFIDELLTRTHQDLIEGRLALMIDDSRLKYVLKAVAAAAPLKDAPRGRARGVAVAKAHGSYVAQIAEVSITDGGEPKVHRAWCAIDCGVVVNPDIVRAQMEGGIGYGLGHILYSEINIENGSVIPGNFDLYRSLRINEMPEVDVIIVPSTESPSGVGEPGVPLIGPAVANALAALGRKRPTRLPMVRTEN